MLRDGGFLHSLAHSSPPLSICLSPLPLFDFISGYPPPQYIHFFLDFISPASQWAAFWSFCVVRHPNFCFFTPTFPLLSCYMAHIFPFQFFRVRKIVLAILYCRLVTRIRRVVFLQTSLWCGWHSIFRHCNPVKIMRPVSAHQLRIFRRGKIM